MTTIHLNKIECPHVAHSPRRFLFVDRIHAHSIWDLMRHIATELYGRGEQVHFCRWDDGKDLPMPEVPAGVGVHDIFVGRKRWARDVLSQWQRFIPQFADLVREIRPDVVHTNFTVPGALARRVAKRNGVPTVMTTQHELYGSMSPHLRLLTRATERYADHVIYISETVARSFGRPPLTWNGNNRPPRHLVIPNGIDIDAFAAARGDDHQRIPGRILATGRLVPVKGYDVLLRAMPSVIARFPQAHLRLAGSGPAETRLRALAQELNIADRVEFLGWVNRSTILNELSQAALVAIPSDGTQEGFGLVAAEALAAGVPIVASRIPVFEEVLGDDGECARLFTRGDAESLTGAIDDTLANPAQAWARRDQGLERVRERFSAAGMVEGYLGVYRGQGTSAEHVLYTHNQDC